MISELFSKIFSIIGDLLSYDFDFIFYSCHSLLVNNGRKLVSFFTKSTLFDSLGYLLSQDTIYFIIGLIFVVFVLKIVGSFI